MLNLKDMDANLKEEIKSILVSVNSNLAACHVKQENWDKTIKYCDVVLKNDENNAKAYYRRGLANYNLNSLSKAEIDTKKAIELSPNDTGIREHYEIIRAKLKSYDAKQKKEFAGMFDRKLNV
ncbi:Tetratricopeptide repeat protein 9A [Clydaea vesicula]|uniref:peptidylprolyl isomerase n=1 Tax=Clydaea vesicula TaxID=447962 RepID=A0AAD5TX45_9FUNG|nr:Tetratricopeptide repeat protein 9A [Clydaea vesicula]KAJ3378991.1 Tetratricopeptide repeat protein 9A [Lobulomyces angularis]